MTKLKMPVGALVVTLIETVLVLALAVTIGITVGMEAAREAGWIRSEEMPEPTVVSDMQIVPEATLCPYCGQPMEDEQALLCPYCGGVLQQKEAAEFTAEPTPEARVEPLTLTLVPQSEVDLSAIGPLDAQWTDQSSVVTQSGKHNNTASAAVDSDLATSWQEGVEGAGIGEGIYLAYEPARQVEYLAFNLGNWRSDEWYEKNNVPSALDIEICTGETFRVEFPQEKERFWVKFNRPCETGYVRITVAGVYSGSQYDDTCIAEVGVYGR